MTNSKDSKYPTRADAARAKPYTDDELRKLSDEELAERMDKFNAAFLRGDKYVRF